MEASVAQSVSASPLARDITAQIQTSLVEMKEVSFHFRTTEVLTGENDAAGKPVMKDWKRPNFVAKLPLLTVAGLIAALQAGDKSTELALEMCNSAIVDRARGIINDQIEVNPQNELKDDIFDMNKLGFLAIANLPRGERGSGIPKESWAAFVADYKKVMASPAAIALFPDKKPRSTDMLEKHGILLGGKFNQVRSRKDVVQQMLGFIDIWVQVSEDGEDHLAAYEFLKAKGNAILQGENFDDL